MEKLFLFVILGITLFDTTYACCVTNGNHLYILNGITYDNISVCKLKDDDLRNQTLTYDGELHLHFCLNFFGKTLYFCNFWGRPQGQVFDVFNSKIAFACYECLRDGNRCYWLVKTYGFYFYMHK